MKIGELVEERKGRDKAGYQFRLKTKVPHNVGRMVCRTVQRVVGGVRFSTAASRAQMIYRCAKSVFIGVQGLAVP